MSSNIAVQQLVANIPAMFCAGIAGLLSYTGSDGWGWMIFLSMAMYVTLSRRSPAGKEDEE